MLAFFVNIFLYPNIYYRAFFMEITKSNRMVINIIMYSLSIAITSFQGR